MKKSYRVTYERDESGWWVASVAGVAGCHTQGRSIQQARRRIQEALELALLNARNVELAAGPRWGKNSKSGESAYFTSPKNDAIASAKRSGWSKGRP